MEQELRLQGLAGPLNQRNGYCRYFFTECGHGNSKSSYVEQALTELLRQRRRGDGQLRAASVPYRKWQNCRQGLSKLVRFSSSVRVTL